MNRMFKGIHKKQKSFITLYTFYRHCWSIQYDTSLLNTFFFFFKHLLTPNFWEKPFVANRYKRNIYIFFLSIQRSFSNQRSLCIRQKLAKLRKQILLTFEKACHFRENLIFSHSSSATPSALLHLQLLLLQMDTGRTNQWTSISLRDG